ncbi:alpha-(1-_3)-arabinofuranosyltransferase domain-containing protein [Knoellia sp. Soil729]|uniref:alpha-(1->3)-arabinofuranosyltransferase domain-containing protein n=1 Tax=Knoellia sp. Soil729 TaxID=1736394 RepID=UPI000AD8A978|nr:alpha-(1->3)-arabinofuranosyltransferase family protein [Knoellia sp. Soil729]
MPVVLATILLLVLLLNGVGVLAPDIKPEIYMAPWREAEALSRAWRESPKLGEPNFNVGLFPVAWLVGAIQELGIGADLSMRLLRWVLLLLGGWGASRLYMLVAGSRAGRVGAVVAAVIYVANPYMVTAGDFLAIVLPAAMLPWMALFLLRATVRGGWRDPAAAALAFAAMSGMNVAVIPIIQLLCLPALLWYAHSGLGASWRAVVVATAKWGLLAGLLSAYWLVPSLAALGAGSHVTQFSESLEGIAAPSSFAEVLRGMGLWPLYGRDVDGPWQPGFVPYLTNPLIVAASFLVPVLLVASAQVVRGSARRLALFLVVPAAVLMVGVHPADAPSPFGHLLLWSFEHVPGAAAFRTTNKVGAVLVLGVALLVGLAAPALLGRARRVVPRLVIAPVAAGCVVLATWPAWSGGLYSLPLPVPDHWYDATRALDKGPMDRRVWFVPGVAQPQYTWSEDRPDDLNNALLARPSFVRITLPESSPYGASLLAAVDTGLQEGSLPSDALSAAARYLGVGDVLVRNDVRWDKDGGARPIEVATRVGSDPGLLFRGANGSPGQDLVRTPAQPELELQLPPLQRYEVRDARDLVRTESTKGLVLVDGDGWALAPLVLVGLLPAQPPFLLTGATTRSALAQALGPTSRLVLTDTNRRRQVVPNRLTGAYGPLLGADEDPGPTIALEGPSDQTVLRVVGGEVSASLEGPRFGVNPATTAENAFDGDPTTAWTFGDFGRARGQSVSVQLARPISVDRIDLDVPPTAGQRITRIRIQADDAASEVDVPSDGRVSAGFPGRTAGRLTVTVVAVAGEGDNPVSLAEVAVPGLQVRRVARLPVATAAAAQDLRGAARDRLTATPTDVVLTRVLGRPVAGDDEETRLDRDFTLPDARDFRVYGLVRPDRAAPDDVIDALHGVTGDVTVTSSSRAFGDVTVRGSRAFDGDPGTGWAPGRGITGEWLEATFDEPRTLDSVAIEQPAQASAWISAVDVIVDGRAVTSAQVSRGRVEIPLPETRASSVRLRARAFEGTGFPIVSEVDVDGARVASDPATAAQRCVSLGTIDGAPVRVRVIGGVNGEGSRLVAGCDPLSLDGGAHELRSQPGWTTDTLVLRDTRGELAVPGSAGPATRVDRRSSSSYRVTTEKADEPYLLVVGQNIYPGWHATMDGTRLGPPVVVDGYAMGWWVRDPGPHTFDIEYGPQAVSDVAMKTSSGAAVVAAGLLLLPSGSGASPAPRPEAPLRVPRSELRTHVSAAHRRRSRGGWLLFVVACAVFAALPGLVMGLAVAAWCLLRTPPPKTLLRASGVAMALAPVAWVVGNLARWGAASPQLVLANPAPSVLVVASLVLLVVGSWRDEDDAPTPTPRSTGN